MLRKNGFLIGALFGSAIGAILAMFYAPQDGQKTRKWLKDTIEENKDKIDSVKKATFDTAEKAVDKANKVKDKIEKDISQLKEKFHLSDSEEE